MKKNEIVFKNKKDSIDQVIKAKAEFNRAVNNSADVLQQGFRQIYKLTIDDDLRRFDFMNDNREETMINVKIEIGLIFMENRNS